MRQENSVLFALRDLRELESDRVDEERRAEESRREEQARIRAAEEKQRQAEAAQQSQLEAKRKAEREQHERDKAALEAATLRTRQLEEDVRQLQALVSAPPDRRVSSFPWPLLFVIAAAAIVAAPLLAWHHSRNREQAIVTPTLPVTPQGTIVPKAEPRLPPSTEAQTPSAPPAKAYPTRRLVKHKNTAVKSNVPKLDNCNDNDPLCGAGLD